MTENIRFRDMIQAPSQTFEELPTTVHQTPPKRGGDPAGEMLRRSLEFIDTMAAEFGGRRRARPDPLAPALTGTLSWFVLTSRSYEWPRNRPNLAAATDNVKLRPFADATIAAAVWVSHEVGFSTVRTL